LKDKITAFSQQKYLLLLVKRASDNENRIKPFFVKCLARETVCFPPSRRQIKKVRENRALMVSCRGFGPRDDYLIL